MMKQTIVGIVVLMLVGCSGSSKKSDSAGTKNAPAQKTRPQAKPRGASGYEQLKIAIETKSTSSVVREVSKKLSKNEKDVRALNALAMHHFEKRHFGLTKIVLGRAFKVAPNNAVLFNNLGVVQAAENEQAKSIRSFRKAIGANPNFAEAAANLGAIYAVNGDYVKAKVALAIAVKKFDMDFRVQHNYALALHKTGGFKTAKEHYQKALNLNNSDSTILLNYAILLIEELKEYNEGQGVLEKLRFSGIKPGMRDQIERLELMARSGKK